jgi:hypothetical protein
MLETIIRDLAARGELSHISLTPSSDGKKWRGSFTMCSKYGVSFGEDKDPIEALRIACTTAKMKRAPVALKDLAIVETIAQETVEVEADDGLPDPCA